MAYLRLTAEAHGEVLKKIPGIKCQARVFLEYGEDNIRYCTSEKFMDQIEDSVKIAEVKYPRERGYRLVWVFDHNSCYGAFSSDALNAYHMNAKPGGKQPCLRDTTEMAKYRKWCSASVYPRTCSGAQR